MKKRIVATMLILSMALSGCGSSGSADTATTSTQKVEDTSSTEDAFSELDALGDVEVDKNIFDVTITLETLRRKNSMHRQKKVISTLLP